MSSVFHRFALGLVFTIFTVAAYAADPIVIRFSHVVAADSPKGKAALRFKEQAEQRTQGRVKVEVHPNATLFKDEQEMAALLEGKVDMLAPALGDFGELNIPDFDVFGMPYIFPGRDMVRRVTDGPVGRAIFKKLEPKGIVGLAYWDNGFKIFAANKPIHRPADVKGLRMRMSSKVYEPMFLKLGTTPIEMGFGATVKALKEGAVDGNENTPSNLYTRKMHELQKHMTVTDHVYLGYAVIANKKFWDGLPADIRVQLNLAMIDATRFANLVAAQENKSAIDKMRTSGLTEIYEPSVKDRDAWLKALVPVHKQFEARVGKDLLNAIYKEGESLGYKFRSDAPAAAAQRPRDVPVVTAAEPKPTPAPSAPSASTPKPAADPIVVRFSHVVAADSPKGKAALKFKSIAEERTKGRVKIEVHPNATLFKDEQEMSALLDGKVEMLAPALGDFGELKIPDFEVFGMPYIFPGRDLVRRITDGPVGQGIFRKLEPKGIVGLAYWDNGFKIFAANKPIHRPEDVKGLRMRMSSKVYEPMFLKLGTTPIEMGFGATVKALKEGTVDGNENTPSNLFTRKMHELQKHMTVTDHVYLGYAVIANKKFWDGLPPDLRIFMKLAMVDATRYANLVAAQENKDAIEKMKASGLTEIYEPSAKDRDAWLKALLPVHKEFESRVGKDLLQAIRKEGAALGYNY